MQLCQRPVKPSRRNDFQVVAPNIRPCLSGCLPKLKSNEHRVAKPVAKRIENFFIKILRLLRFCAGTSLSTNRTAASGDAGVGQTFQSAGSRNFPVPCFHLRAIGQVRMRVASRMNGRLESRPTGRLESLPYKSERLAFSCGCLFPHLPSWPCAAAGTPCGGTRPTKKS